MIRDLAHYIALYYRHARGKFIALLGISVLGGIIDLIGIGLLLPILNLSLNQNSDDKISQAFNQAFEHFGITPDINTLLLLIVGVFCLKGIMIFLQKYWSWLITIILRRNIQSTLIKKIQTVNYSTFSSLSAGTLNNIMVKEAGSFASSFTEFSRMLVGLIYILFYGIASAMLKPEISVMLVLGAGLIHLSLKRLSSRSKIISEEVTEGYGLLSARIVETLHHYIYLKATSGLKHKVKTIIDYIEHMRSKESRMMRYTAFIAAITEPIAVGALALLVFYQVSVQGAALTEIVVVGLLLYRIFSQVLLIQGQWQRFNGNVGSIKIIESTLDNFSANQDVYGSKNIRTVPFPITLEDVSFSHGNKKILDKMSLTIEKNKMVGLVGASGAGKTSLFYILTGLLAAESGSFKFGKTDYADINPETLRRKIGYVTQDPAIFEGSIRDNLTIDGKAPTKKAIETAFKEASCLELLEELDKPVGENGKNLSGGQKQRLSIARELLKKPEIMIFDEATSALDPHADKAIRKTIDAMRGSRTIVIITHRLNSVKNCDDIHVMKSGKIAESGTYKALSKKPGSQFSKMLKQQA